LPCSEACERNKEPILAVLRLHLPAACSVLEIGSGTGQHAVFFASRLPQIIWQPTETAAQIASLAARTTIAALPNLRGPLELDVHSGPWPDATFGAVFTANTLHIVSWPGVTRLLGAVGGLLAPHGLLLIYGPFRRGGKHTSDSNAQFDAMLRRRDAASGVRDFEAVDALAAAQGLRLVADHEMPANNRTLVWEKSQA
jgi:SAM-dependent methyltransferase